MKSPVSTPVGSFSKSIPGGVALNFSPSGGSWCSRTCAHHPANDGKCYAVRAEGMKPSVTVNLERKREAHSAFLEWLAHHWTPAPDVPWVRFAVFGAVPHDPAPNLELWRALAAKLAPIIDRVHLPVETTAKYERYSALGFRPRLSLAMASPARILAHTRLGRMVAASVKGEKVGRESAKRANERAASQLAAKLRRLGRKTVVCPAITRGSKCGRCTACASTSVDVVLYPEH